MLLPLAALLVLAADLTFPLPPVRATVLLAGQPVELRISGTVTQADQDFAFSLQGDLASLQDHITPLLQSELNQDKHCGERISVVGATLLPAAPAARLEVRLHVEKWACVKAFGKENARRLLGGNAIVVVDLTPEIRAGSSVHLGATVARIEADGSLGELLRSGSVGELLRDQVRRSLVRAVERSSSLEGAIPATAQPFVNLRAVRFAGDADSRLMLQTEGTLTIPPDQIADLLKSFRHNQR